MEEKERYEYYLGTNSIKDNKTNQIYDYVVDLLNQQDKENQQLKQQLNDLPKKIVEEIRKELNNIVEVGDYFDTETDEETNLLKQSDIENILDTILKKYGGEDE